MNATLCLIAALLLQSPQSDEEKAIEAYKAYIRAIKSADYERACDVMHPKSLVKFRNFIVKTTEKAPNAARKNVAKKLGFAGWAELEKAAPRALFVAFFSNFKEFGELGKRVMGDVESAEATIVGALKKDGKVYIIVEMTTIAGEETRVTPLLQVAYKDGEHWKLTYRGEANIGK